MSIGQGLRVRLLGDNAITALVGARIYPGKLPQKPTLPAVTYFRVSGQEQASNVGAQGYGWARYQFDTWSETYTQAEALEKLVKDRLHAFRGTVSSDDSPPLTWVFQAIFALTVREFYESEPKQYRVSRDFMVWVEGD